MWQTSLLETFGIAGLIERSRQWPYMQTACKVQSQTTATVQSNTNYTLAGDAIAVQKLRLAKTMTDGTTLVKIYYMKAGETLKLSGPYTDLGGYTVTSTDLPKIDTEKYVYVLNDEGLSQDGLTLNHQDPATKMSKDGV